MDRVDLIVKMIGEQRDSFRDFHASTSNHQRVTESRLSEIESSLKEHIRRTNLLEDLHKDNQKRISALEAPSVALNVIKKGAIVVGSILGVIMTIVKLMEYING